MCIHIIIHIYIYFFFSSENLLEHLAPNLIHKFTLESLTLNTSKTYPLPRPRITDKKARYLLYALRMKQFRNIV